jgi:competence protein ComEA
MAEFVERWRVPIALVLIVAIISGLAVLYIRWPRGPASSTVRSLLTTDAGNQTPFPIVRTPEPRQSSLKVYVTGEVAHPGVYSFRAGERVEDALKAAGGATADADLTRLNLAQRLEDEGYIFVPRLATTPLPTGGSVPVSPAQNSRVNLNTASLAELDALPGIGATYAQRIVDYRTKNGPYQRIQDLVDKKLIPQSTFDKIKDLIDVR